MSRLQDTRVPEKTQAVQQKPAQDFTAVLTLVTARSGIVSNDGGSTAMAVGQGRTCPVYVFIAIYIICVQLYLCHLGAHLISGCLVFNQKIHSFNAMTQIIKKFSSFVKQRNMVALSQAGD